MNAELTHIADQPLPDAAATAQQSVQEQTAAQIITLHALENDGEFLPQPSVDYERQTNAAKGTVLGDRSFGAVETVKNLYNKIGADVYIEATGGVMNNPPKFNERAKKRRIGFALGICALGCAKVGIDLVKAGYGLHGAFQTGMLGGFSDLAAETIPQSTEDKMDIKTSFTSNIEEMAESSLDYTQQGLDAFANTVMHTPQSVVEEHRRKEKQKQKPK